MFYYRCRFLYCLFTTNIIEVKSCCVQLKCIVFRDDSKIMHWVLCGIKQPDMTAVFYDKLNQVIYIFYQL